MQIWWTCEAVQGFRQPDTKKIGGVPWYCLEMRLRLILKFLALVSIIGIVSFQSRKHQAFLLENFSQLLFCPDSAIFSKTQEIPANLFALVQVFFHKLTLYYLFGQIVNPNLQPILSKLCNGSSFYQLQIGCINLATQDLPVTSSQLKVYALRVLQYFGFETEIDIEL